MNVFYEVSNEIYEVAIMKNKVTIVRYEWANEIQSHNCHKIAIVRNEITNLRYEVVIEI